MQLADFESMLPLCAVELTGKEFTEIVEEVVTSWLPGRTYVKVRTFLSGTVTSMEVQDVRSTCA